MKNTIIIAIFIFSNCSQNKNLKSNVTVDIWDYNYSMSYTVLYHIDNDSLIVKKIGNLKNEKINFIINRKLTDSEKIELNSYFFSFPIEKLDTIYNDSLVQDGDRKKIDLKVNGKNKTILIANYYQNDIANLINFINQFLESDYKLIYSK